MQVSECISLYSLSQGYRGCSDTALSFCAVQLQASTWSMWSLIHGCEVKQEGFLGRKIQICFSFFCQSVLVWVIQRINLWIIYCSDILAAFIIRGRRLGRSVTLKTQFWKVVFDKEKPWNEEIKLCFFQRKLHLSSHCVGRVWIPVRAASKQPKKLLRLQLQPLRLSTIHNYHTSNKIITHSTFIDNYRTSKTIITLS